jgi:hypothetical protein
VAVRVTNATVLREKDSQDTTRRTPWTALSTLWPQLHGPTLIIPQSRRSRSYLPPLMSQPSSSGQKSSPLGLQRDAERRKRNAFSRYLMFGSRNNAEAPRHMNKIDDSGLKSTLKLVETTSARSNGIEEIGSTHMRCHTACGGFRCDTKATKSLWGP